MMIRLVHACRCRTLIALAAILLVLPPLPALAAEGPPGKLPDKPLEPWAAGAPKDLAGLQAIEARVKTLVEKLLPTTVAVRVGNSQGSGVIVSNEGHVLTAGHVVDKPNLPVVFTFADGKTAKGVTLGAHHGIDAGLMKIAEGGPWPFAEMGRSENLPPGAWCLVLGHPLGYHEGRPPVLRVGRVLFVQRAVLQTDCTLVSGDSGGPLFDLEGRVIGINSRISGLTTMNFHVPVDIYREFWDRLVKGEHWQADATAKESNQVKAAFGQVVAEAAQCVVRITSDGQDAALGTIVGPDGWILTKASELRGRVVCHAKDGRQWEPRIVGVNPQFDLAMLKVDVTGLPIVQWSSQPEGSVGRWVATPGLEAQSALALGVVSVPRRTIPPPSGALGIVMTDADNGVRVTKVLPEGAAHKAGLRENDVITHVNGAAINRTELSARIKRSRVGDVMKLTVQRGAEKLELSPKLTLPESPGAQRQRWLNSTNVGISARSNDFPMVLQHDSVLRPNQCGGPLVDLTGKVVGVNIARGGRTESYAIPTDVLLPLFYDLMSGRLAPPKPPATPTIKPEAQEPAPKPEMPKVAPKPELEKPKPQPEAQKSPAGPEPPKIPPKPEPEKAKPEPEKAKPQPETPKAPAKPEAPQAAPKHEPEKPKPAPEQPKPARSQHV